MTAPLSSKNRSSRTKVEGGTHKTEKKWRSFFGKSIVLVLAISLGIHLLFLVSFGSVAIFKGKVPQLPFVSQKIPAETQQEIEAPPAPESDPLPEPAADATPLDLPVETQAESTPVEADILVSNFSTTSPSFAPPPPAGAVTRSQEGSMGARSGASVSSSSSGSSLAVTELFGVPVQAKKLGVIVDVSGSMQKHAPGIFREIFEKFPDADVMLTNGGGMMEWEKALKGFNEKVASEKIRAKETGKDYRGPSKMERPRLARFNTKDAEDWVPVRGPRMNRESYRGLKEDYPDLYEQMRRRGNTWFITSYADANAVYLAFEELIQRKAEAIYWFSDFADPIEGKEAENVTRLIQENKVSVILHSIRGKGKAAEWAKEVQAKFVKAKI